MPLAHPKCRSNCPKRLRRQGLSGFTLIELIMVIVMLGVLAVVAAPKIFNSNDFNARGFHDETLALLRYAQKAAIAQRRTVCVSFPTDHSVSLTMASAPATFDCATSVVLRGPTSDAASITAKSGVTYSAVPGAFNFDALGQPITAAGVARATQTIQVNNAAKSITVETVTGYVHE
jgi:MSHA pilin protein MshC